MALFVLGCRNGVSKKRPTVVAEQREDLALVHRQLQVRHRDERAVGRREDLAQAWEKQVLSARGFKRVGRCSEYAI